MERQDKIDMLKFTIGRCDHYYDSVNNKGNLYLTLNTFLLGGIITGYYAIRNDVTLNCFPSFLFWTALVINVISIGLTLYAIKPFLGKKRENTNASLLYFGDISSMNVAAFQNKYEEGDTNKFYSDLTVQTYMLSCGLRTKFSYLKIATYFIGAEFLIIAVIGINILK